MPRRTALLLCALLTAFFSAAFIPLLPLASSFLRADVRAAVPHSIEKLRRNGVWLVNVSLVDIIRSNDEICFVWDHEYRSRTQTLSSETIITCQ